MTRSIVRRHVARSRSRLHVLEGLEPRLPLAAASMLADVNQTPNGYLSAGTPIRVGDLTYLSILDPRYGSELWVFDADSDVPRMVKDIFPGKRGADPSSLTEFNGRLYFSADDGLHGQELWTSDGTLEGTHLVADISPLVVLDGPLSSSPAGLTVYNGELIFVADDITHGRELWRTDGTAAGTSMIVDLAPGETSGVVAAPTANPADPQIVEFKGQLYFAGAQDAFDVELWVSDGTEAGTRLVRDIQLDDSSSFDGSFPQGFTASEDFLYFIADTRDEGRQVFRTDGTEPGTIRLADVYAYDETGGSNPPTDLELVGDTLFFWTFANSQTGQLWTSDGTPAGTQSVASVSGSIDDVHLQTLGSKVYFAAPHQNRNVLWSSDGTPGGTGPLVPGNEAPRASAPRRIGNQLYFVGRDNAHGEELWTSDGTAVGTHLVADLHVAEAGENPAVIGSSPFVVGALHEEALFVVQRDDLTSLFISDGTEPGTRPLFDEPLVTRDSKPFGFDPTEFVAAGRSNYFVADDGVHGRELWRKAPNGDVALVDDVFPGPYHADPTELTEFQGQLYFIAQDPVVGSAVFRTHSDGMGVERVDFPGYGEPRGARELTRVGDALYVVADSEQFGGIWSISEGRDFELIYAITYENAASSPRELTAFGAELAFVDTVDGSDNFGVFSTRSQEGVVLLSGVAVGAGESAPGGLFASGDRLYFSAVAPSLTLKGLASVGPVARSLVASDFNADGNQDVAVIGEFGEIAFAYGDGEGNFTSVTKFTSERHFITVDAGDFNNDGRPDLVTGNYSSSGFSIFLQAEDGSFAEQGTYYFGKDVYGVAVADLNGDGNLDVVAAGSNDHACAVFLGRGDGTFPVTGKRYGVGPQPLSVALADLNGDGALDLISANADSAATGITLRFGDGQGDFGALTYLATGDSQANGASKVVVGDVTSDGIPDLITDAGVFAGDGTGNFTLLAVYGRYFDSVGDVTGDGLLDLVWGNTVQPGLGDGTFGSPVAFSESGFARALAADINNDSQVDVLILAGAQDVLESYVSSGGQGRELWVSDGGFHDAHLVADINPSVSSSNPRAYVTAGDRLYFLASNDEFGVQLWTVKNGETGAQRLTSWDYADDTYVGDLVAVGGRLFFAAEAAGQGRELWTTDGTVAGTRQVADIWPGDRGSHPMDLVNLNGVLVFTADDGVHGRELWRADANATGAWLLEDLVPGRGDLAPLGLQNANGVLYFIADDGTHGLEPWSWTRTAGDVDLDGVVGLSDLNALRNHFGYAGDELAGDVTGDGIVGLADLNAVRNNFGAGNAAPKQPERLAVANRPARVPVRADKFDAQRNRASDLFFVPGRDPATLESSGKVTAKKLRAVDRVFAAY